MGNEFLGYFIPVPVIVWACNLWQCRSPAGRRKHVALLVLGLGFMACMVLPVSTGQHFLQGFAVGGFLYLPSYLVAWLVVSALLARRARPARWRREDG